MRNHKYSSLKITLILKSFFLILFFANQNVSGAEYVGEQSGLKFQYGQPWKLLSNADSSKCDKMLCIVTFQNLKDDNTFIKITIQKTQKFKNICQCDSLLEFVQYDFKKYYEPIKTFSIINDNQTILNGNISVMQMEYTSGTGDNPFHYLLSWIKNNDIFYRIVYQSDNNNFNQFLPNFKNLLNSIELFDPNGKQQITSNEPQQAISERKKPSFMTDNENEASSKDNTKNIDQQTQINDSKSSSTTNVIDQQTIDNESSESSSDLKVSKVEINDTNFDLFYSNPQSHLLKNISITGKIFNIIPSSIDTGGIQIYHLGSQDKDTVISYSLSKINNPFNVEECVKIEGSAGPNYEYTNAFGAYRSSPMIFADAIQKIDCLDMVDPKAKIVSFVQTLEKGGIKVTLHKVEFDDKNTRAFLSVENTNENEEDVVRFFDTSDSKAFQEKRQYEPQYSSSYPDISSEIPAGIEESGVVVFEPLEYGIDTKFQFGMRVGIDDYKFVFNTNTIGQPSNINENNQMTEDEELQDNDDNKKEDKIREEDKKEEDDDEDDNDKEDDEIKAQ